jgi:hypothetical protein
MVAHRLVMVMFNNRCAMASRRSFLADGLSMKRSSVQCALILAALALPLAGGADEPRAEFFRGVNLNGPPVDIDGRRWEGGDTKDLVSRDRAFEDQSVPLVPPTDPARALMIRSSRWGDVDMKFTEIPAGTYSVFLYVWEDNVPETFSIFLNGREVVHDCSSGQAGSWKRLGPWRASSEGGALRLTTKGGAANLSGIEIWKGSGPVPDPFATAQARDPAAVRAFDEQVAPVLARHCLECHGATIHKGGLSLATENAARKGGDSGPAVEPGEPEASPLWEHVASGDMPKGRPGLSDAEKGRLRKWIADGAKWGTPEIDPFTVSTDRRAGYDWWSLRPVRRADPPPVKRSDWPRNDVDRFVLARMEARGLTPAPEADRRTLIRRLSFDLIGLPPEPGEVERFVADRSPDAYETLVDRLLASPHHGARWARHWLDVIRFGESQGFEYNRIRDNAWRYRDWVVDAFNRDLPYDEFVKKQVAGDVLYPKDLDALIATGDLVCGTWDQPGHLEGSESMRKSVRQDALEEMVATLGQSLLGLTINCARCHDHKFEPISQKEYYQVAALLGGVTQEEKERGKIPLSPSGQANFSGVAHVVIPRQPPVFSVLERGDHRKPREVVAPAGLKALSGLDADFGLAADSPEGQRRAALARWLSDPRNPLTARVFVNRLWYHHFGQGLVETPSDFGFNGGRPSHPELLDFLASRFVDGGWRIKEVHRLLVTSAAYRQDSRVRDERAEGLDAENRLLWRANRRRLEGEAVRDAALAVAGALNPKVGGPSFRDVTVKLGSQNHEFTDPTGEFSEAVNRRTLYRLWARSGTHPLLDSLDCPDPSVMAPRRTRTITPLQALSMSNNPFMEKCAERFAARIRHDAGGDEAKQVEHAWRLAFARPPGDREARAARSFVAKHGLDGLCLVLFNANEFLFID